MVPTANDTQTGNDTQIGLQIIPNRKYDSRCGPQMIPPENEEWHGVITIIYLFIVYLFIYHLFIYRFTI